MFLHQVHDANLTGFCDSVKAESGLYSELFARMGFMSIVIKESKLLEQVYFSTETLNSMIVRPLN